MPDRFASDRDDRCLSISSVCHAGGQPTTYAICLDQRYYAAYDSWFETFGAAAIGFRGSKVSGDSVAGRDRGSTEAAKQGGLRVSWDSLLRERELDKESLAGKVIFPDASPDNHPPSKAGLAAPRSAMTPDQVCAGPMAHNRWLSDFCSQQRGRHLGVAVTPPMIRRTQRGM
jgi:hypothetical protein